MMKNNRFVKIVLSLLVVLLFFVGVKNIENRIDNARIQEIEQSAKYAGYIQIDNNFYTQRNNLKTLLLVGLDSMENEIDEDSNENNMLADFIVLFVLNTDDDTITPIQINRDTMCEIQILGIGGKIAGKETAQIALSHAYGSGELDSLVNVKDAVRELMYNIKIDYYVSLPMESAIKVNDLLGGVKVLVEDDFKGVDDTLKEGKEVTLKGEHALNFVRSRSGMSEPTNLNRMNRQITYLESAFETYKESKIKNVSKEILTEIADEIISNTNGTELQKIMDKVKDYELDEFITLVGENVKGDEYMEYYVDEEELKKTCIKVFYKAVN